MSLEQLLFVGPVLAGAALAGCVAGDRCQCIVNDGDGRILAEAACGDSVCLHGAQYECSGPGVVKETGACPGEPDGTVLSDQNLPPTGSEQRCVGRRSFDCHDLDRTTCYDYSECDYSFYSESCEGRLQFCDSVRSRGECLRFDCSWIDSPADRKEYCPPRSSGISGTGTSLANDVLYGDNYFESDCSTRYDRDVPLWWTPPEPGRYRIDTHGSTLDTVLAVHTGCNEPAAVCNDAGDDVNDFTSAIEIGVVEPHPLLIVVSSYEHESGGYVVNIEKLR